MIEDSENISNTLNAGGIPRDVDIPLWERILEAAFLSAVAFVAFFGNVSLWIIIIRNRSLRSLSNGLVLCLSSADILVSVINIPVSVVSVLSGQWLFSQTACTALGFMTMLTFVGSVMSLGVISISRYVLICQASRFKTVYTRRNTALMITGVWLLSALLASPPLFGWAKYSYIPGQSFCFCEWKSSTSYTFFMVGVCFGGPCSVMSFCYVRILQEVRASKKRIHASNNTQQKTDRPELQSTTALQSSDPPCSSNVIHNEHSKTNKPGSHAVKMGTKTINNAAKIPKQIVAGKDPFQERKRKKREEDIRLTTSLLVVILVFIICWLPYCVTMFMSVFSDRPVSRLPDIVTVMLGYFNSGCNPVIYGLMNTKFRRAFIDLYCVRCRKRRQSSDLNVTMTLNTP